MPARRSPCGHVPGFALHPERGLWLNGVIRLSLRGRLLPIAPKKDLLRCRRLRGVECGMDSVGGVPGGGGRDGARPSRPYTVAKHHLKPRSGLRPRGERGKLT